MDINQKIDKFLIVEAKEDFYQDRKNIEDSLRVLADKIRNIDLPDPDSDLYARKRKDAKAVLSAIANAVSRAESTVNLTLKSYKPF